MYCLDYDILNVPVDVLRPQTIVLFVCLLTIYVMNRKEIRYEITKEKSKTLKIRRVEYSSPLNVMKRVYHTLTRKHNIQIYILRDIDTAEPFIHFEPLDKNKPMRFSYKALDDLFKIDLNTNALY